MYFHHGGAKGGAPLSLLYVLIHLKDQVDIHVVSCKNSTEVVELYSKHGLSASHVKIPFFVHSTLKSWNFGLGDAIAFLKWVLFYPFAVFNFFRAIRNRPDIVHLNSSGLLPYAWVPWVKGIPCVCHVREPFAKGCVGLRRWFLRQIHKLFIAQTIAICESNAVDTKLPESRISVVYNPVSSEKFDVSLDQHTCRSELGVSHNAPVALFAGGSNAMAKGLVDFLKAMVIAKQTTPDLICLMPSFQIENYDSQEVLEPCRKLGESVLAAKFTYEIEKWLVAADVVFALHKTPHFSRTVAEAGMVARPVIVYRIDGIEEVVDDCKNGILVEANDYKLVAEKTVMLMQDRDLRTTIGQTARGMAQKRFEACSSAKQVLAIYEKFFAGVYDD